MEFFFFFAFSSLGNPSSVWGSCCGLPGWVRGGWGGGGRRGTPAGPPAPRLSGSVGLSPGAKPGEEPAGDSPKAENEPQPLHGSGICKWFNVRMGFGFLSMTAKGGATLDSPVDVFVHQVRGRIPRGVLGREGDCSPWHPLGRTRGGMGTPPTSPPHEAMAPPIPARHPEEAGVSPGSFPQSEAGGEGQARPLAPPQLGAPHRGPAL